MKTGKNWWFLTIIAVFPILAKVTTFYSFPECVKEVCHKIFYLHFFNVRTQLGPWFGLISLRISNVLKAPWCASPISPQSQTPGCVSLTTVKLCDVHHTKEPDSTVWITLQSQWNIKCLFYPKFYKCYLSVMPEDNN